MKTEDKSKMFSIVLLLKPLLLCYARCLINIEICSDCFTAFKLKTRVKNKSEKGEDIRDVHW